FYDGSYDEDLAGPPTAGLVIDLATGVVTDGWGGRDTLSGVENVVGSGLDDVLLGNANDNDLEGGAGDDEITGGAGSDTASYHSAPSPVSVDLAIDGPQQTGGAGTDTLAEIENIDGSNFGDTLAGDATANVINGGSGADLMSGGDGNDTYYVDNEFDEVFEEPGSIPATSPPLALGLPQGPDPRGTGAGIDTVIAQLSYTLKANVENLVLAGTAALDGAGNDLDNLLTGNGAANRLSGLDGRDVLDGGAGNDTLSGGAGNDTLGGGNGNDVLGGGAGADALRGGGGADGFLFDDAPAGGGSVDTVLDFSAGTDKLRLDDDVFTAFTAGTALTAAQLRAGPGMTSADAPGQRLIYDTASGALYYDADGNGTGSTAVQFAVLGTTTHPSLSAADFLIVT
ncbi:MAG: calcium-binding protein, partial [Gammaproteobacteria bacterium]